MACLALTGCAGPGQDDAAGPVPEAAPLDRLRLDNCQGLRTALGRPSGMADVGRPPGWDPADRAVSEVVFNVHECERISIGPFERGPVTVAFEMHNDHSTPDNCTKGDYTTSRILHKVWLSDAEVADWLAGQGLPAAAAGFTWMPNDLGSGLTAPAIVIAVEGAQPSELRGTNQFANDTRQSSTDRLFWAGPGGVGYIDLHADLSYNAQHPGYFMGAFHEPFLYAQSAVGGNVAGLGGFYDYGWMDGEVRHFRGFECAEESP